MDAEDDTRRQSGQLAGFKYYDPGTAGYYSEDEHGRNGGGSEGDDEDPLGDLIRAVEMVEDDDTGATATQAGAGAADGSTKPLTTAADLTLPQAPTATPAPSQGGATVPGAGMDSQAYVLTFSSVDAARCKRLEVQVIQDDVKLVRQNQHNWVRKIRAACLSKKKGLETPLHMTGASFAKYLEECENKIVKLDEDYPTQVERFAWVLFGEICEVHELGMKVDGINTQAEQQEIKTKNMKCSDRMRLIVEIVSEYANIAEDLVRHMNLNVLAVNPLNCLAVKIASKGCNEGKKLIHMVNKVEMTPDQRVQIETEADKSRKAKLARKEATAVQADEDLRPRATAKDFAFPEAPTTGHPLGFYAAQAEALARYNLTQANQRVPIRRKFVPRKAAEAGDQTAPAEPDGNKRKRKRPAALANDDGGDVGGKQRESSASQ